MGCCNSKSTTLRRDGYSRVVHTTPASDPAAQLPVSTATRPPTSPTEFTGNVYQGSEAFPPNTTEQQLIAGGGIVIKPYHYLPVDLNLKELYSPEWMVKYDALVSQWYNQPEHTEYEKVMMHTFNGVVKRVLARDYIEKKQVGIMGGWCLRTDPQYTTVAVH